MCDSPPLITNGEVSPDNVSSPVGISLTFTCEVGYHLNPTSYTVRCDNDEYEGNTAAWSGTFPLCGEWFICKTDNGVFVLYCMLSMLSIFVSPKLAA